MISPFLPKAFIVRNAVSPVAVYLSNTHVAISILLLLVMVLWCYGVAPVMRSLISYVLLDVWSHVMLTSRFLHS